MAAGDEPVHLSNPFKISHGRPGSTHSRQAAREADARLKVGPDAGKPLRNRHLSEGAAMSQSKSQAELHDILRGLLRESFRLHAEGSTQPRLGRAEGLVDGFIRALVESGLSDHKTLLAVVRDVRRELGGEPTAIIDSATLAA
jgi:hypothetical protein